MDKHVEVTQEDIEAVKRFHGESARWMLNAIKNGDPIGEERDLNHPIYQAFARHRIAAWNSRAAQLDERIVHVSGSKPMCAETAQHLNAIANAAVGAMQPAPPLASDGLVEALERICNAKQMDYSFDDLRTIAHTALSALREKQ